MKHRNETDPEKIKMLIARGEYVIKEVEALYMLRKYRTLKQRYYKDESKWQRRILNSKLQDYLPVWRNQLVWPTPAEVKGLEKNVLWSNWAKHLQEDCGGNRSPTRRGAEKTIVHAKGDKGYQRELFARLAWNCQTYDKTSFRKKK